MDIDFDTIVKRQTAIFNLDCRLDKSKQEIEFDLPGWPFDAFTRTGRLGLWNICRVFEVARILTMMHLSPEFSSVTHSPDGSTILPLVYAQRCYFRRELYLKAAMKFPITGKLYAQAIGKSSITLVVDLLGKTHGELLGSIHRLIVYRNITRNKSENVPTSIVRMLERQICGEKRFKVNTIRKDEADVTKYLFRTKICASDADLIYHTNQAVYYRICLDAAYEAGKRGFLDIPLDICDYDVEDVQGQFRAESFIGDELNVHVWTDVAQKLKLHFQIDREDDCIFLCNIKFYPHFLQSHL